MFLVPIETIIHHQRDDSRHAECRYDDIQNSLLVGLGSVRCLMDEQLSLRYIILTISKNTASCLCLVEPPRLIEEQ